ncbi:hypothetical protein KA017_00190 [Candidatus Woesebacteria bacterium]|nr:hypothetical protein [Candidatus Woesebacteria bacterium]
MKKRRKQKKYLHFLLLVVLIIAGIAVLLKLFKPDHTRSEGSITLITSDGTKTDILLDNNSEEVKISTASANHNEPFSRGDFIVWIEEQQNKSEKYVVRYHVPTNTTYYITNFGVAQNPKVNTQGQVVWQQWNTTTEIWQIVFFDGYNTAVLTSDQQNALNPDIAGTRIIYSKKNQQGIWQAIEYSLTTKETVTVSEGTEAKHPFFYGTELFFL